MGPGLSSAAPPRPAHGPAATPGPHRGRARIHIRPGLGPRALGIGPTSAPRVGFHICPGGAATLSGQRWELGSACVGVTLALMNTTRGSISASPRRRHLVLAALELGGARVGGALALSDPQQPARRVAAQRRVPGPHRPRRRRIGIAPARLLRRAGSAAARHGVPFEVGVVVEHEPRRVPSDGKPARCRADHNDRPTRTLEEADIEPV